MKLYQVDVVLDDARVSELRRKDEWDSSFMIVREATTNDAGAILQIHRRVLEEGTFSLRVLMSFGALSTV